MESRKKWIDVAKCVAIMAVMIDHLNGTCYNGGKLSYISQFSVSLFIFLSGITFYLSSEKYKDKSTFEMTCKRIKGALIPYAVAVFFDMILAMHGTFMFSIYVGCLIHFSAEGPHYYISVYLQLILIGPLLYGLLKRFNRMKKSYLVQGVFFVFLLGVAAWTTNCTNILDIIAGGGKLFGGTYLCLFYLGMLFASKSDWFEEKSKKSYYIIFAVVLPIWIGWSLLMTKKGNMIDSYLPFGPGSNPPSFARASMGVLMAFVVLYGTKIFAESKVKLLGWLIRVAEWIGKYTLYIFLYHWTIVRYILEPVFGDVNIWVKRISYLPIMVGVPILIKVVYDLAKKWYVNSNEV